MIEELQTRKPEVEEVMQALMRIKERSNIRIFNQPAGGFFKFEDKSASAPLPADYKLENEIEQEQGK